MPLRVRLSLAFVAIVIVPLAVTVFLIHIVVSRNANDNTKTSLLRGATAVSSVVTQLDKRAGAAALGIADMPAVQQAVRDGSNETAQRLVRQQYEAARAAGVAPDFVAIATADGAQIAAAGRDPRFRPNVAAPTSAELASAAEASPYAVFARSTLRGADGVLGEVVSGFWLDEGTLRQIGSDVGLVDIAAFSGDRAIASTLPTPPPALSGSAGAPGETPVRVGKAFASRVATLGGA
ncbi:MAG: hypothetical protein QOG49_802, partial [Frankiaceae bacterium]|nr:hypothetical protein [Frankiaceae bacterium]